MTTDEMPPDPGIGGSIPAILLGGKDDGRHVYVTEDCEIYWVGPVQSAWVAEADLAPGNIVGSDLVRYDLDPDAVGPNGERIYRLAGGMEGRA